MRRLTRVKIKAWLAKVLKPENDEYWRFQKYYNIDLTRTLELLSEFLLASEIESVGPNFKSGVSWPSRLPVYDGFIIFLLKRLGQALETAYNLDETSTLAILQDPKTQPQLLSILSSLKKAPELTSESLQEVALLQQLSESTVDDETASNIGVTTVNRHS